MIDDYPALTASVDLDPRWEWVDVTTLTDRGPQHLCGRCNHLEVVPVESIVTGQTVARLCLTCDAQMPAELVTVT